MTVDHHRPPTDNGLVPAQPITLKEVQLRLGAPQHILIHLCEKGVITPDFAETSGRGKRRGFSELNVFEFAVALALRKLDLPVATTALVVRVLRSFGRAVGKALRSFELPGSLVEKDVQLTLHLYDGAFLVLQVNEPRVSGPLILRGKLTAATKENGATARIEKLKALPAEFEVKLEVDLTAIARRIAS